MKRTGVVARSLALGATIALLAGSSAPSSARHPSLSVHAAEQAPPSTLISTPISTPTSSPTPTRHPLVFAHRGGIEHAGENTMAAFDDAITTGVDYIETDVRHSADGVAFLVHDPALPRVCAPYAGVPVRSLTSAQLAQARCHGRPIPRLSELVARLRRPDAARTSVFPEVKDGDPLGVRDALSSLGWSRVIVQSSDYDALRQIEQASPEVRTCPLVWAADGLDSALAVAHGCVAPEFHLVNAAFVARAHAVGAAVVPFTVDDPVAMRRLLAMGCDGLITNRPRAAFAVRR
jgi:glycerophosphoryl diester phosphodiesterase